MTEKAWETEFIRIKGELAVMTQAEREYVMAQLKTSGVQKGVSLDVALGGRDKAVAFFAKAISDAKSSSSDPDFF